MADVVNFQEERKCECYFPVRVVMVGDRSQFNMAADAFSVPGYPSVLLDVIWLREIGLEWSFSADTSENPTDSTLPATTNETSGITTWIPQHESQLSRFLDAAELVVIAYQCLDGYMEIARQVTNISQSLGIKAVLFPMRCNRFPLVPRPATIFTNLVPAVYEEESNWPMVLNAILSTAFAWGLVCVDWNDIVEFIEATDGLLWKQFDADKTVSVMGAASEWVEEMHRKLLGKPFARLMIIYRDDHSFGMSDLKRELSLLRALVTDDGMMLVGAPTKNVPAVTILLPRL